MLIPKVKNKFFNFLATKANSNAPSLSNIAFFNNIHSSNTSMNNNLQVPSIKTPSINGKIFFLISKGQKNNAPLNLVYPENTFSDSHYRPADYLSYIFPENDYLVIEEILNSPVSEQTDRSYIKFFLGVKAFLDSLPLIIVDEDALRFEEIEEVDLLTSLIKSLRDSALVCILNSTADLMKFDKIILLEKGKIIEFGHPLDLIRRPGNEIMKFIKEKDPEVYRALKKSLGKRFKKNTEKQEMDKILQSCSYWALKRQQGRSSTKRLNVVNSQQYL